MQIDFIYTSHDWGFGFEFSIPSTSSEFFERTKLRIHFGFDVYLGPFTLSYRPEPEIIAFQCAVCLFEHTGDPAFVGPVPGFVICEGCHDRSLKSGEALHVHSDNCEGECE